jgi:hypothetical protein
MRQILTLCLIALLISGCSTVTTDKLTATVDYRNDVSLHWSSIGAPPKGFEIKRDNTVIGKTGTDGTIYSDKGLTCGKTHSYTVTPTNADSKGATKTVNTGTCPPPNRTALIIGNSDYQKSKKLKNPEKDAKAVAKKLKMDWRVSKHLQKGLSLPFLFFDHRARL